MNLRCRGPSGQATLSGKFAGPVLDLAASAKQYNMFV